MTGEKIDKDGSQETVPFGNRISWVEGGTLVTVESLDEDEGISVIFGDPKTTIYVYQIKPKEGREFLLPNGEKILPT